MAASAENDCDCTNISIMQLFHELKQKFPAVPDRVVSECIRQNFHDKGTCEAILSRENATYLLHSYPPSLKMSSSETESSFSAKLQNLTLCDKCKLGRPCCTLPGSSGNQASETISLHRNLNIPRVQCVQEELLQSASSSNTHVLPGSSIQPFPSTGEPFYDLGNSVKRSGNKCQYQQIEKSVNTSQISSQSVSSKSQVFQEGTSVSHSNQFSSSDPHWLSSHKDNSFNLIPHLQSSASCSGNTVSGLTPHKSCNRLTSLNVDQTQFYHNQQAYSAPVISTGFEPFHCSNNNLPTSSVCEGLKYGNDNSHSIGAHHSVRSSNSQNEQNADNIRKCANKNNPTDDREEDTLHDDQTVVNSYQVNVNCSLRGGRSSSTVNVSGTSTRSVTNNRESNQKAKSVINLQPAPHYAYQNIWGGDNSSAQTTGSVSALPQQPRSYTSVNLTLRPPSSEPQAPIDIHSGGSSLMYSTSSYDPNQGFRSKLQICIGPGGAGSVSAMRTQVHEPTKVPQTRPQVSQNLHSQEPRKEEPILELLRPLSTLSESTIESTTSSESTFQEQLSMRMDHLHAATQVLLKQQLERKNRLQQELRREKEKLRAMRRSVRGMEKDLAQRQLTKNKALPSVTTVQKVQRLKQEIRKLTEECEKMAQEVDNCSDPRVPLGETDEEFYKNIYTGQRGYVGSHPSTRGAPPYRPDPGRQEPPLDSDAREGRSWTCSECTFRNYWELKYCEQCDMPRIVLAGGETQDIHIHVTHHNFPIRIT